MKHTTAQNGFTIIEMLSVFAIFTILTSITLFNYGKFRSETILTNMAYEVALSIREAQIYGVSARRSGDGATPSYDNPYGIYMSVGTGQYYLFADTDILSGPDGDGQFNGTNCTIAGGDTCITPYTMQQNIIISDIQKKTSDPHSGSCQPASDVSIVFRRPNPEPQISGDGNPPSFVQITIEAPNGSVRYVLVYNNGQISVENSSRCN